MTSEQSGAQLAEGWEWATLGNVFSEIKNGTTATQNKEGRGVPVTRIETIQNARFDFQRIGYVDDASPELIRAFQYHNGDIAFSHINSLEHVGKTALYEGVPEVLLHGMNLLRLRLGHDSLHPRFLYSVMQESSFREGVRDRVGRAVNQVSINQKRLSEVPFPIAPLAEQPRIVAKLDELFVHVNSARDHLSRVPAILKRFRQAVLATACSGKLTANWREKNLFPTDAASTDLIDLTATLDQLPEDIELPQDWKLSTLDKLLTRVEAGKNIRCLEHPPGAGQKGIVKISAVSWGDFLEDESKTLEDPTLFMPERAIRAGDLLISRANTIDLVGACVLVRDVKRTLMLSDKVLRLQAIDKWKRWLLICLRSPLGRFQIENLATGNQLSMRNITQDSLRRIVIPLPSPRERDEAVHRVEQLLGLADAIEKRIVAATSRCNNLTQSILAKAFRGELVPTEAELARREGRVYEPASVLLDRIKKERETKISSKPERKQIRRRIKR
jgi:type I restriction enzyme S subunit